MAPQAAAPWPQRWGAAVASFGAHSAGMHTISLLLAEPAHTALARSAHRAKPSECLEYCATGKATTVLKTTSTVYAPMSLFGM